MTRRGGTFAIKDQARHEIGGGLRGAEVQAAVEQQLERRPGAGRDLRDDPGLGAK